MRDMIFFNPQLLAIALDFSTFSYPELEKIAIIQHYGGSTRLIDFTYNAYIALFFSIMKFSEIRRIWGKKFSFTVYALSKILFRDNIPDHLEFDISKLEKRKGVGDSSYLFQPEVYNIGKVFEERKSRIEKQKSVFVFTFNPLDIIRNQIVSLQTWHQLHKPKTYIYKIIFKVDIKELHKIYTQLNSQNINLKELFPDLPGICTYLNHTNIY